MTTLTTFCSALQKLTNERHIVSPSIELERKGEEEDKEAFDVTKNSKLLMHPRMEGDKVGDLR